jgi:hypothetical protein
MTDYFPTDGTLDQDIDGLLYGAQWDTLMLDYSFPENTLFYGQGYGWGEPQSNFEPLTSTQIIDPVFIVLSMQRSGRTCC